MQTLPGFREFFPEDCARRNVILDTWRRVARRSGFVEYDGPTLESYELYARKNSGGEILSQLFEFEDKGGRRVALRPEMTPTLARMAAARQNHYRKPLKWFSAGPCFRYEKQQKGRLREFLQLNCDLIGDASPAADAEIVALAIDTLRAFGLGPEDFYVRVSDRNAWLAFLAEKNGSTDNAADFLSIVDKIESEPAEKIDERLRSFGTDMAAVRAFIAEGGRDFFEPLRAELAARGLDQYIRPDLTIVRGLAYYTGMVFEIFSLRGKSRAIAGGGRYDHLLRDLSGGAVDLPAVGFGMGDVVLGDLIAEHPTASQAMQQAIRDSAPCEVFVVIADEAHTTDARRLVQQLRDADIGVDFSLSPAKVGKQFQMAEHVGARYAVVVGSEWPRVRLKKLATRMETECDPVEIPTLIKNA